MYQIIPLKCNFHWNLIVDRLCDIVGYMHNPFVILALCNTRKCIEEYEEQRLSPDYNVVANL
jgi:hypothetical protein